MDLFKHYCSEDENIYFLVLGEWSSIHAPVCPNCGEGDWSQFKISSRLNLFRLAIQGWGLYSHLCNSQRKVTDFIVFGRWACRPFCPWCGDDDSEDNVMRSTASPFSNLPEDGNDRKGAGFKHFWRNFTSLFWNTPEQNERERKLRSLRGPCFFCGAGDMEWCRDDCPADDPYDWR